MSILCDKQIHELALDENNPMIVPFYGNKQNKAFFTYRNGVTEQKVLSFGTSSYGYDIRLASEIYVFTNRRAGILDPLDFDHSNYDRAEIQFDEVGRPYVLIPPNGFILGHSEEYIRVPDDVSVLVLSKSTYARIGNFCLATPLEAGWHGQVTLEFANTAPSPSKMYVGQGCAQLQFFRGEEKAEHNYVEMGGKYQGQTGVTFSKG